MNNSKQYIAGLDHLRAVAIILVFLFHYRLFAHPGWVDTIGSFGWTGVDLFFVLSGYLIASQLFKELKTDTFSLRRFFLKRFFRILPAYWTVLALYFLLPSFREWEHLPPLWKLLRFTQNFGLDLRTQRTFSHAWSLCIEEQFYLLLPFMLLLLHRVKAGKKSAWLLVAFCVAGFMLRTFCWFQFIEPVAHTDAFGALWYKWIYFPTYNRLDGLLAGISIAAIFQYNDRVRQFVMQQANVLLLTGIVLLATAYWLCESPMTFGASVFGFPLIALSFGLMVAAAASPGSLFNKYHSFITAQIATLSYTIYLTHKAAIHFTQNEAKKFGINAESGLTFLLCVIVATGAAMILHYTIEKPFLELKKHILRKQAVNLSTNKV